MKKYVVVIFAILSIGCTSQIDPPATVKSKKVFLITHSMKYLDGPDLSSFGVPRNPIIYQSKLVTSKDKDQPQTEPVLQTVAKTLEGGPLPTVIDIERWNIYVKDTVLRKVNLQKLIFVIESLRKARPDIQFGYYGVVPQRVYWQLVDGELEKEMEEWKSFNTSAKNDFVPHVDAIFPSLYTFYSDSRGWETYAIKTLTEARKFNKPVYAYLWPKFHNSNQKLMGQYIPADYWKLELETCYKHCDGIVIWNSESKMNWDPEAPWWKETLAFMEQLKNS